MSPPRPATMTARLAAVRDAIKGAAFSVYLLIRPDTWRD